jgi:autotransporter-associated beta strand protein
MSSFFRQSRKHGCLGTVSRLDRQASRSAAAIVVAASAALGFASSAHAALTWENAGPTNNWSTAGGDENWTPGNVVWTNGEDAVFGATTETVTVSTANTVDDITFNGSWTIANGAGSLVLSTDGNSDITVGPGFNSTIAETLSGTNAVTKLGNGTLSLIGTGLPNTFSGGLTISAGTVAFDNNTALGGTGGTAGAVSINGGTLRAAITSASITNTHVITVGSSGGTISVAKPTSGTPTFILGNAGNLTGNGNLTLTGDGTLGVAGANSVLVLGNANATYNGNVTIQNGAVVEYANAGGINSGGFIVDNNGMLSANGVTNAKNVTLNNGGYLAFQNGNSGAFSGPVTLGGNAGIRMQDWYGTTVRNGAINNTITGAGTISVDSGNNAGTGGVLSLNGFDATASSADVVLNGASLAVNSSSGTAAASVTRGNSLTVNSGNLSVTGVASQNTNDVFGTLNLGGGSTTTAAAGILQGYSTWTITPNAATNAKLTFTNMGTRSAGSWVAINSTVGATPAANTANIYFTNALSSPNLIGSGGTLAGGTASVIPWLRDTGGNTIYGYDTTVGVASITSAAVDLNSATTGQNVDDGNGSTLTGNRAVNSLKAAFSTFDLGGNTLTVSSGVITADNATFNNGTLAFGTAEGQLSVHQARTLTINTAIAGSGGLTFVGFRINSGNAGRLILAGPNTYTGVTNFYGYGAATADFYLNNSLALQNTTVNYVAGRGSTLFFGNGGTSGQTAYTFGGLIGNANINLNNINTTVGAVALTIGSAGSADTASTVNSYSGVLSSTVAGGSVIKEGVATQAFSGVNTYGGGTSINNGRLLANTPVSGTNSATGTGSVTVNVNGILGGTGQIAPTGANGINVSGSVAPGASIGTLTINLSGTTGGVNMASGSTFTFELGTSASSIALAAAGSTSDRLAITGASAGDFAFSGNTVNLSGGAAGYYKLFDTTLATATNADDTWTNLSYDETTGLVSAGLVSTGNLFFVGTSANGGDLGDIYLQVVPEPSALAMLLGGGLLALQRRRSRRVVHDKASGIHTI